MSDGPIEKAIMGKLDAAFAPAELQVINESRLHAGHQDGAMDGTGETHFRVRMTAAAFDGMSRVARHRAVNEALAEELRGGVHALALELSVPGEPKRR